MKPPQKQEPYYRRANKRVVSLYLDPGIHAALRAFAALDGCSLHHIVQTAVLGYLNRRNSQVTKG